MLFFFLILFRFKLKRYRTKNGIRWWATIWVDTQSSDRSSTQCLLTSSTSTTQRTLAFIWAINSTLARRDSSRFKSSEFLVCVRVEASGLSSPHTWKKGNISQQLESFSPSRHDRLVKVSTAFTRWQITDLFTIWCTLADVPPRANPVSSNQRRCLYRYFFF